MRRWVAVQLSIIVPTFNEAPNVAELLRRVAAAAQGIEAEVIFVDDSTDDTPDVIREAAASASLPVRLVHRSSRAGGLGGAVVEVARHDMQPGDRVLFYTDGVVEARRGREQFGVDRLDELLGVTRDLEPQGIAEAALAACRDWTGGELADDFAVVVVKRTGTA